MDRKTEILAYSERNQQILAFIKYATSIYVIPLFLLFSIADWIWYHRFFEEFLLVRILTAISVSLIGYFLRTKISEYLSPEKIGLCLILACGAPINYMIFRIGDAGSPYYAGLLLIVVGLCIGLRLTWKYHFICLLSLLLPYLSASLLTSGSEIFKSYFLLNLIFFTSLSAVGSIGKLVYEKLIIKELDSRMKLNSEVDARGLIIEEKTNENIKLSALSKQFSPQIIDSIKRGEINLDSKVHDAEIAVIFVDIVDSTRKVIEQTHEDTQIIVSNFIDDVMSTFLKFDVTIDKFLGDGFMGFTNDPLPRKDYLERAVLACRELLQKIKSKKEIYDRHWQGNFEVRVSIALGDATVGFYGNEKYLKTYTAIGKPVILASRLNGAGEAFKVTVSENVLLKLKETSSSLLKETQIQEIQQLHLKGFEKENVRAFSLAFGHAANVSYVKDESCPHGHGQLVVETNKSGFYELRCRYCDFVLEDAA